MYAISFSKTAGGTSDLLIGSNVQHTITTISIDAETLLVAKYCDCVDNLAVKKNI